MATIGEALIEHIGGPGAARHVSFLGGLETLRNAYGSDAAAARAMDVPASTWRGWRRGRNPRGGGGWIQDIALEVQRRASLDPAREARMRQPWALDDLTVTATFRYTGGKAQRGSENRELPLGAYMHDVADELLDAYLNGAGGDELAAIFTAAINDNGWYHQTFNDPMYVEGAWDVDYLEGWN